MKKGRNILNSKIIQMHMPCIIPRECSCITFWKRFAVCSITWQLMRYNRCVFAIFVVCFPHDSATLSKSVECAMASIFEKLWKRKSDALKFTLKEEHAFNPQKYRIFPSFFWSFFPVLFLSLLSGLCPRGLVAVNVSWIRQLRFACAGICFNPPK